MTIERRLIEDFIPIREISVQSAREKSIRKGHISTLHLWWARRPLVAARAAVFASLVAAPETHQKRSALTKAMIELCKWETGEETIAKARKQILEAQRDRLKLPSDTPLKDVPAPKVLDMFAGGGAIPLEALRLGCETYAVDLNPVAHIIQLCTLVYPQQYGKKLADEVETWGKWVIERVRSEIGDLYPAIETGGVLPEQSEQLSILESAKPKQLGLARALTPVAYLWTRTVKCPNPGCGATVPLVRQTWLCKKDRKSIALKVIPNHETKRVEFEVVEARNQRDLGFNPALGSSGGNSTCRHCGTTLDVKYVKKEGVANRVGQQLMAVVCTQSGERGKVYLAGKHYDRYIPDESQLNARIEKLCAETELTTPLEPLPNYGVLGFRVQPYGLLKWSDLFTSRQLLALLTFVKWVRLAHQEMLQQGYDEDFGKAISTYLALCIGKCADLNSSCNRWKPDQEGTVNTFSRQALPMVWDYSETNSFGERTGSFEWSLRFVVDFIDREKTNEPKDSSKVIRGSSAKLSFAPETLDAVITDPPYFDSVPYADLSDFFYCWHKRSIGHLYPEHFSAQLTPKKNEAIMEPTRHGGDKKKAAKAYEDMMHQAFCEASRVLKAEGVMVVVYAHKTTSGWTTLIDSLRRASFTITEAWALDTEGTGRLRAQDSAALASSIFLVARKRQGNTIGDYAIDVRPNLTKIVQERVKTLMEEGITGADLVIACIGAGLRAYTQYQTVELPNGEELDAQTFLDEVQKEVVETVLTRVMQCDRSGISLVDKTTQYYIMGRYEYGDAIVDFDEANTLAKGIGIELDSPTGLTSGKGAIAKKVKTTIQLQDYSDRGADPDLGILKTDPQQSFNVKPQIIGNPPTLIDILHRLLWLAEHKPQDIPAFLSLAQPDATQLRLVAQALAGRALTPEPGQETALRTKEQSAIDTLLASWKRLVEDNLFTQSR